MIYDNMVKTEVITHNGKTFTITYYPERTIAKADSYSIELPKLPQKYRAMFGINKPCKVEWAVEQLKKVGE